MAIRERLSRILLKSTPSYTSSGERSQTDDEQTTTTTTTTSPASSKPSGSSSPTSPPSGAPSAPAEPKVTRRLRNMASWRTNAPTSATTSNKASPDQDFIGTFHQQAAATPTRKRGGNAGNHHLGGGGGGGGGRKSDKRARHPSERPLTELNMRHQEMLGTFTMKFGRRGSADARSEISSISPCASRSGSVDLGRSKQKGQQEEEKKVVRFDWVVAARGKEEGERQRGESRRSSSKTEMSSIDEAEAESVQASLSTPAESLHEEEEGEEQEQEVERVVDRTTKLEPAWNPLESEIIAMIMSLAEADEPSIRSIEMMTPEPEQPESPTARMPFRGSVDTTAESYMDLDLQSQHELGPVESMFVSEMEAVAQRIPFGKTIPGTSDFDMEEDQHARARPDERVVYTGRINSSMVPEPQHVPEHMQPGLSRSGTLVNANRAGFLEPVDMVEPLRLPEQVRRPRRVKSAAGVKMPTRNNGRMGNLVVSFGNVSVA